MTNAQQKSLERLKADVEIILDGKAFIFDWMDTLSEDIRDSVNKALKKMKMYDFVTGYDKPTLTFNEYQQRTGDTAVYDDKVGIQYNLESMVCEAGEALGKLTKLIRKDGEVNDVFKEAVSKELGDTLWHLARAAFHLGYDLETIASENLSKLKDRQERNVIIGDGDTR